MEVTLTPDMQAALSRLDPSKGADQDELEQRYRIRQATLRALAVRHLAHRTCLPLDGGARCRRWRLTDLGAQIAAARPAPARHPRRTNP